MKILAIDYGSKNIGLALSDDEQKIAFAYKTLNVGAYCNTPLPNNTRIQKIISDIKNICEIEKVKKIIIGLPLWLTGDESATTKRVIEFARELEKGTGLPMETVDERLSTVEANKLFTLGKKKADNIDELSAQILLAGWLEKMENYVK
ncbi:Holliday junction resolvase RuvX [Candidatus Kuenenbacteria bacterium CG23_combo_of_CG06-09_8_20_14_all_36_9]|uniref:Putative pre-16S rRNA nuclease n=1 Tax=Candidatus Kuenenbacteria bacterium CG10_big_fil_rev_8_21_14_0_10_36_11 TaxID=1974618 RepID=A0A2M6WAB8_9BACT|nr:MAG: Holliday junction resolvase RuvX [Candidatus Kuenenbacteria bacterium CG23_combo_of_CG06-09_8_20_14_all_36_9]PIT89694.1 MAG: Holliday junction resolvase RuvX [Candidatus Kuenenbacteria bacterium CG10_big_fil_rev_8_21_14_0_10_36_11]